MYIYVPDLVHFEHVYNCVCVCVCVCVSVMYGVQIYTMNTYSVCVNVYETTTAS